MNLSELTLIVNGGVCSAGVKLWWRGLMSSHAACGAPDGSELTPLNRTNKTSTEQQRLVWRFAIAERLCHKTHQLQITLMNILNN